MQSLEHGDLIAQLGQVAGAGQAGRAGTDDGHLVTVGSGLLGGLGGVGIVPVGHKALQTADGHGLALHAPDAVLFALVLLGADAAADGGQRGGLVDDLIGGFKVALSHLGDEIGDVDLDGASVFAGHLGAAQAAGGLFHGHLLGVAQGYLAEILIPHVGLLSGHGVAGHLHIGHGYLTSFLNRLQASS